MSSAFVRETAGVPQVYPTRESAESAAELHRLMDGANYEFEVRERDRGGFMVARLTRDGSFESWVSDG